MLATEAMIPIAVSFAICATIFGIYYFRTKENLSLIEHGFNPKERKQRPSAYVSLKYGLLLAGAGMGLLAAYILDVIIMKHGVHVAHEVVGGSTVSDMVDDREPVLYFAMIAIGGGLGLIISYAKEKKDFKLLDR
ncbi:DUF6249 domain-containing protein [Taibaiella soli]|uniref:DUF6249 domain-containing protein n=1 Tax=Taibaiella soli TaxID=1649169 RepID=A0A2W2BED6_9BACT|nr:DUF6249 domain-containing protein [Taibaiella soli]PZF74629.1 hypothetical protein DN068_03365 [Taibaiella soli]